MVGIHDILGADIVEQPLPDPLWNVQPKGGTFRHSRVDARAQDEFSAAFFTVLIQVQTDFAHQLRQQVRPPGRLIRREVGRIAKTQFDAVDGKTTNDFFDRAKSESPDLRKGKIEGFRFLEILPRTRVVQAQLRLGLDEPGNADALFPVMAGVAIIDPETSDKAHAVPVRLVDEDI